MTAKLKLVEPAPVDRWKLTEAIDELDYAIQTMDGLTAILENLANDGWGNRAASGGWQIANDHRARLGKIRNMLGKL